jgi:predicted PurR-regulated permease PerM
MNKKELILRSIKIFDIAYIFSFYAIAGFILSIILNKIYIKYDRNKYDKKSTFIILLEICFIFATIGIVVYMSKNLFEKIPFPLDGIYGYDHTKVKEINTAIPLTYTILFFSDGLRDKLYHISRRYFSY